MNVLAALLVTASAFVTPTPAGDIDAFIKFMYANERCPGLSINFGKTLEQVRDLGAVLQWDDERTRDHILVNTRLAQFEYQQDRGDFCAKVRTSYQSYDPAYLKRVGVVN